jgi:hypothetical protein
MILALVASAAAAASPGITYLQCSITQDGQPREWTITLNEPEGIATYDPANGAGFVTRPAKFTGDAVYFIGFKLSRVDLTIERQYYRDFHETEMVTDRGQCQLSKPAKRAF